MCQPQSVTCHCHGPMDSIIQQQMRNIWLFLLLLAAMACSRPAQEVQEYAVISAEVHNPAGDQAEVYYITNVINNQREEFVAPLDTNNAFELRFPLDVAREVYVHVPRRTVRLYLEPGARIHLVFDAEDLNDPVVMSGDNTAESAFLQALQADVSSRYGMMTVFNKAGEKGPEAFRDYVGTFYREAIDYLEGFARFDELNPDFLFLVRTHILYEKYRYLVDYPMARAFFGPEGEEVDMSDDYFDFLLDEALFDDAFTVSRHYFSFLNSYISYRMEQYPMDDELSHAARRFAMAKASLDGKSRDMVLAESVISALNFGDFDEAVSLYTRFMQLDPHEEVAAIASGEYEIVMALSPGRPAPGFQLTDINGEEVSLEDFRGKVVYLDFWASWCGPCLQQIPHAKQLKKRIAGRDDLVFLYVSVDMDKNAWRRAVSQHDIQGVHLHVEGFGHEVPSSYNLKGVPTFYLIGRDGNILDNRPPRPSHKNIDEVLLAALEGRTPREHPPVTISGRLDEVPGRDVELNFFRDFILNDRKVFAFDLDDALAFSETFEVPGPLVATLSGPAGRQELFLESGYDLVMEPAGDGDAGPVAFSGLGANENSFLVHHEKEVMQGMGAAYINEQAGRLGPDQFRQLADSLASIKVAHKEEWNRAAALRPAFVDYFTTRVKVEKYRQLMAYPGLHQRLNQLDEAPDLPADYYDFLEEAIRLEASALDNPEYVNFLLSYLDHRAAEDQWAEDHPVEMSIHHRNYLLAGIHLSDHQKYKLQAVSISREMNSGDLELARQLYEEYMEASPVRAYKESLESGWDRIRSLWAGEPAPGFSMTDIHGNEVSLSDYKGKVVYLKFWASWCPPCMRQVPPAAELKERFAGEEDLVFMYVSIDTDDEAWRRSVERNEITGLHMRTPGRERGVPALYNVRWIPTFYVIGRDGRIFDHRPPQPADQEVDEVLMEALRSLG